MSIFDIVNNLYLKLGNINYSSFNNYEEYEFFVLEPCRELINLMYSKNLSNDDYIYIHNKLPCLDAFIIENNINDEIYNIFITDFLKYEDNLKIFIVCKIMNDINEVYETNYIDILRNDKHKIHLLINLINYFYHLNLINDYNYNVIINLLNSV